MGKTQLFWIYINHIRFSNTEPSLKKIKLNLLLYGNPVTQLSFWDIPIANSSKNWKLNIKTKIKACLLFLEYDDLTLKLLNADKNWSTSDMDDEYLNLHHERM